MYHPSQTVFCSPSTPFHTYYLRLQFLLHSRHNFSKSKVVPSPLGAIPGWTSKLPIVILVLLKSYWHFDMQACATSRITSKLESSRTLHSASRSGSHSLASCWSDQRPPRGRPYRLSFLRSDNNVQRQIRGPEVSPKLIYFL